MVRIDLDDSCYTVSKEVRKRQKKETMETLLKEYDFLDSSMTYSEMEERIYQHICELMAQDDFENLDTKES